MAGLSRSARITLLLVIELTLFVTELMIGYAVGSLALVADGFNTLNDAMSLVIFLSAIRLARQRSDHRYTYGWQRAEILAALINSVFQLALCFSVFLEAIGKFFSTSEISNAKLLVIVGSVGLASNIVGFFLVEEHDQSRSRRQSRRATARPSSAISLHENAPLLNHSDYGAAVTPESSASHSYGARTNSHSHSRGSVNMHAGFLRVTLSNISVIVTGLLNWLTDTELITWLSKWKYKYYCDPIMSLVITAVICYKTLPLARSASYIMLQGVPKSISLEQVRSEILAVRGIERVHELHVWQLSEPKIVASVHVTASRDVDFMVVVAHIRERLHRLGIHSCTVQPEYL